jgi:hypothetical protein
MSKEFDLAAARLSTQPFGTNSPGIAAIERWFRKLTIEPLIPDRCCHREVGLGRLEWKQKTGGVEGGDPNPRAKRFRAKKLGGLYVRRTPSADRLFASAFAPFGSRRSQGAFAFLG